MGSDQSTNRNSRRDATEQRHQSQHQPERVIIYERVHTPYSYAQGDLQNEEAIRRARNVSLYPDLANMQHSGATYSSNNAPATAQNSPGYVFVEEEGRIRRVSSISPKPYSHPTPSAPPAPGDPSPPRSRPTPPAPTQPASTSRRNTSPPRSLHTPAAPMPQQDPSPPRSLHTPAAPTPRRDPSPPRSHPTPRQDSSSFRPSMPQRYPSRDRRNNNNQYTCPTCNKSYVMNIYQCQNGHRACSDCRLRARRCGLCGLDISNTRNFTLEDLVGQTKLPCPNASEGCSLNWRASEIENHLTKCPYSVMDCPVNTDIMTCRWRGKPRQMQAHFDNFHPSQQKVDVDTELVIRQPNCDSHNIYLLSLGPFYFVLHEKVDSSSCIYFTVQLLGTAVSASKWDYEVHVYNKKQPRRKYTYTGPCNGMKVSTSDIFKMADCATLPMKYARTFVNENILTYKVFIKKLDNAKGITTTTTNTKRNFAGRGKRISSNNRNN